MTSQVTATTPADVEQAVAAACRAAVATPLAINRYAAPIPPTA